MVVGPGGSGGSGDSTVAWVLASGPTVSAELEATGLAARARDAGPVVALTSRELQIAELLAEGRTTRETAAALFLSPKTVEYHLRHIYTKLDITSRAELREHLVGAGTRVTSATPVTPASAIRTGFVQAHGIPCLHDCRNP
ncbi:MAG: helix-turn-helix transcriptional regulator [Knoellia sp.]